MGSPDRSGDVLAGRYRVERVIGEGGMGLVVAAQHLVLGERVALKLLLPSAARNADAVTRFQREARAALKIPSEHVVRVMDVGTLEDGTPYLVMEYVEGRDLAAELEARGPLPIEEAIDYILQAAIGVSEAHGIGIVHRDLKPSNLFLARLPNGRTMVKVLDFGIAKIVETERESDIHKLTKSFSALGSISYMSPEQLRTAKDVDPRADVWAFGVVLFELLTGRMPFNGETLTAIASSITADRPHALRQFRPDAPAELEAVIQACLEKERQARIHSVAALGRALAPFGGKNAMNYVSRVIDVDPGDGSSASIQVPVPAVDVAQPVFSGHRESRPALLRETVATGPSWTTSEDPEPATVKDPRGRRWGILAAALVGVGLLAAITTVAWSRVRGAGVETVAAQPSIAPVSSAETPPPAAEPAEVAPAPIESAAAEPDPSTTAGTGRTSSRSAPSTASTASGKKSKEPPRKPRKPLVTDL